MFKLYAVSSIRSMNMTHRTSHHLTNRIRGFCKQGNETTKDDRLGYQINRFSRIMRFAEVHADADMQNPEITAGYCDQCIRSLFSIYCVYASVGVDVTVTT